MKITSQKFIPRDQRIFFAPEDRTSWAPALMLQAELNLPLKSIADHFGCSYNTLATNEEAMEIVRRGWNTYRLGVEAEIRTLAFEQVLPDMDPVEKAAIRASKIKALALMHKVLHADPFVPPQETERIRRLTDEELQAELAKHVKSTVKSAP